MFFVSGQMGGVKGFKSAIKQHGLVKALMSKDQRKKLEGTTLGKRLSSPGFAGLGKKERIRMGGAAFSLKSAVPKAEKEPTPKIRVGMGGGQAAFIVRKEDPKSKAQPLKKKKPTLSNKLKIGSSAIATGYAGNVNV